MTKRPCPYRLDPYHQRGVAVIMALLLTTLAITIVASLFWQQQVQVRSIENQRLQLQKQWILRGALDWAGLILREDAKHSATDNLDEPWAVSLAETRLDQYVENGQTDGDIADATLSGSISDAQARYNLTNLCPNGVINADEVAVFGRLLKNIGINPALAQETADMMAAAAQQSTPPASSNGSNGGSRSSSNPVLPMSLNQPDDLLAVPGFTPEMFDQLKDLVIFLPRVTPVNVNTASAQILAARIDRLALADATQLVASRERASFRDWADFSSRLPTHALAGSANQTAVVTSYFLVNGKVRMSRASLDMQALIERTPAGSKLIWIREY